MSSEGSVKVIVPLDGSDLAQAALSYLPVLAKLGTLEVRLLGVVDDVLTRGMPGGEDIEARQEQLHQDYLDLQQRNLLAEGFQAETLLRRGNPGEEIVNQAESWPTDLVLISTHGRSGFQRWRLGSVADKVIRGAHCDTLVVGPHPAERRPALTSILVPLDGSPLAEEALPVAKRLAQGLQAELHLVRVLLPSVYGGDMGAYAYQAIQEATQAYLQGEEEQLATFKPHTAVLNGAAADAILDYAAQQQVGLIVLTSHGRGGFLRLALGSVADRLLSGPAPVLIVRPAAASHGGANVPLASARP